MNKSRPLCLHPPDRHRLAVQRQRRRCSATFPATLLQAASTTPLWPLSTHADLVATLQGPGPFTVFAPTDQAFVNAGINLEDYDTPEENQTLGKLLLHHVVSGEEVASSDLKDGMMTATMNDDDYVKFGVGGGTVTVGAATGDLPRCSSIERHHPLHRHRAHTTG